MTNPTNILDLWRQVAALLVTPSGERPLIRLCPGRANRSHQFYEDNRIGGCPCGYVDGYVPLDPPSLQDLMAAIETCGMAFAWADPFAGKKRSVACGRVDMSPRLVTAVALSRWFSYDGKNPDSTLQAALRAAFEIVDVKLPVSTEREPDA